MANPIQTFKTFYTAQDARDYRHEHGAGGWIFAPEKGGVVVLFPPDMTPSAIFRHPLAKGQSGDLIGNG